VVALVHPPSYDGHERADRARVEGQQSVLPFEPTVERLPSGPAMLELGQAPVILLHRAILGEDPRAAHHGLPLS